MESPGCTEWRRNPPSESSKNVPIYIYARVSSVINRLMLDHQHFFFITTVLSCLGAVEAYGYFSLFSGERTGSRGRMWCGSWWPRSRSLAGTSPSPPRYRNLLVGSRDGWLVVPLDGWMLGECGEGAGDHGAGVLQGPHPHLPGIETGWLVGPLDGIPSVYTTEIHLQIWNGVELYEYAYSKKWLLISVQEDERSINGSYNE